RAALEQYPIEPTRLRLLEHGYNTTFRVDTADGDRFALRIGVNRRKPVAALDGEMAWLAALARDTGLTVPAPLATREGALHTPVRFDELDTDLNVAVMTWLPGRDLDTPSPAALHELGRITAVLHGHARSWQPPASAEFPRIDSVLMDVPDRIRPGHPAMSDQQQAVFAAALDHVEPLHDAMVSADELIPIHADLHGWNLKWLRGRMAVFDFDDAGLGVRTQDLAITSYYQRPEPGLREALLAGYETVAPLPPFTPEQFEATIAARNLLLANELVEITTAEIRAMIPTYLENTRFRMQAYLDTGVYRPDVPGVVTGD
ncbi:MAG: phosphotransferase, partial [Ilumatobacter sp.]|nr:phosphotransferase [Ilumatobacter sp.]